MICFYFRSKQIFFSQTSIDFKLALSAFIRLAERSTGETSHSLSEVKMASGGSVHLVLRTQRSLRWELNAALRSVQVELFSTA